MTRRAALKSSRNQPQQPRSRATVSVILDAAIRVLDREGLEALTTSRVAEVAGVSVGTLYQYFAHRDAIIDALQDRELERAGQMLERVLKNPSNCSDREVASAVLVEPGLALHAYNDRHTREVILTRLDEDPLHGRPVQFWTLWSS